jgi:hypothetical protein
MLIYATGILYYGEYMSNETQSEGLKMVNVYLPPDMVKVLDRAWKLRDYESRTDMVRQVLAKEIGYELPARTA